MHYFFIFNEKIDFHFKNKNNIKQTKTTKTTKTLTKMVTETRSKTASQMELDLERREDEYRLQCERKYNKDLEEEKMKINNKIKALRKSYDYGVLTFVFVLSFVSVAMYRNIKYETIDSYFKTNYPHVHEKVSGYNFDMNTYNILECSLIVAAYHYIMYKIIVNRFAVMITCGICSMYACSQLII